MIKNIKALSQNDLYNCALYAYNAGNLRIFSETIASLDAENKIKLKK